MDGGIVPAAVLVPPEANGRGFSAHDSVLVLDGYLRRLASQHARCRAVLGRLARKFLARRGHHELGFARLGDYGRQRLGFSARELQSLAVVSAGLERLTNVGAAFASGELSWSQARLLVGVATPDSEQEWLHLARGRTVRALAALIHAGGRPASEDEDGADEPRMRFRLRCPTRLVRLWHHVVELARRMSGDGVTLGEAAEAIAAEGLGTRPACGEPWPAERAPAVIAPDPDEGRDVFVDLDWKPVGEALPDDVAPLAEGIDDLDPRALDERMSAVVRAMHQVDWQTGRLLRTFLDRRLYRLMLFPSAGRYLTERLGMSARKARALVALERKTWDAPAFGDAYRGGALSSLQALTLMPVITEQTADAWVARAQCVTLRRLADEVEWALTVRDGLTSIAPPPPRASLAIPERQMCARPEWEWPDAGSCSPHRCRSWRSFGPRSSRSRIRTIRCSAASRSCSCT